MCLKLFNADGLADDDVGLEVNTHLGEVVNLHVDNLIWQAELRNTILQHTADLVQSLEDVHIVTLLYHIASERKSGRA